MPRCWAIVGALTRLTCSSPRPCSAPTITASPSRRVSKSAILPEERRLDALHRAALGELHREASELRGERQERAEHLHVLGADRGDVDGRRDDAAGQRRDDLLGALVAGAVGRLGGRGAEVRRDDDVGVAEQRVLGRRLAWRTRRSPRPRPCPSRAPSCSAPSSISPPRATFSTRTPSRIFAKALGVEEAFGLRRLGQVDGDEVRLRVEVVDAVRLLDAELAVALGADERVEGDARACRSRARAARRAGRCARSRGSRASSRRARRRSTSSAPICRRSATRRPAACCARAPAAAPSCARRRSRRSTRARWRRRSRAAWRRRRRRCRPPRRRDRSPAGARRARSARRSASSPSGSRCRRSRRSARPAARRSSRRRASTSKCSRSSATPGVADLLLDEHPRALPVRALAWPPLSAPERSSSEPLDDPVDAGGQRLHVGGLDRGEHRRPAAGCARACGRARRRRSRSRAASPRPRRRRRARRSRSCRRPASAWPGPSRTASRSRSPPPSRTGASRRWRCVATHQSRPPPSSIQRIWSASRNSVATAGVL